MTTELKTQLSLILLAGIATVGLLGFFFKSVHKDFALYQNTPRDVAAVSESALPADQAGEVLGAADSSSADSAPASVSSAPSPASLSDSVRGIYVNPFSGVGKRDEVVLSTIAAPAVPTAPIQIYVRGYVYPMAELSGCSSEQACLEYCRQLANVPVCAVFSQRQGLMTPEMVAATRRLVAGSYPADSRVLGASDNAADLLLPANPYANLMRDYSNPALDKYIASTAGSGCAPLDMICLSQPNGQENPRVLAARIEEFSAVDGESGGGSSGQAGSAIGYTQCLDNASSGIAGRDPATILPAEEADVKEQISNCQQNFGQAIGQDAASQKQESITDILGFQDCVSKSRNLALDIKQCIDAGFR